MINLGQTKKIKRAILGGSFDPVHLGHLYLLKTVFDETDYNRIYIVPVNVNNFKRKGSKLNSCDRLALLYLAKEDFYELYPEHKNKEIIIDDRELIRKGISYTYDTVMEIKKEENITDKIGFVMGDDLIAGLDGWYKIDELRAEVEFVVFNRFEENKERKKGITYISNECYKASSTEIRNGKAPNMLSKRVAHYVKEKALQN